MSEDTSSLAELMLQAEVFCAAVEGAAMHRPAGIDWDEMRLKISQCRGALAELQISYDEDQLTIGNESVRENFRYVVMSLLWINFRGRELIDFKLYRQLVKVEAGFTQLLVNHCSRSSRGDSAREHE